MMMSQDIFDTSGDWIYVANGDGTITAHDEYFTEIVLYCEGPDAIPRIKSSARVAGNDRPRRG